MISFIGGIFFSQIISIRLILSHRCWLAWCLRINIQWIEMYSYMKQGALDEHVCRKL